MPRTTHYRLAGGAAIAATLLLAGCASSPGATTESTATPDAAAASDTRVTLTYDGGLYVLDGETLDVLADIPLAGFNRVNTAGDGRHVFVTTTDGFQVLDTGAGAGEPELTDVLFRAVEAGHVVKHEGKTVLFADGTGDITIFDTDAVTNDGLPESETVASEAAHHGVAIELADGTLLSTIGTSEARTGVRVLDESRTETARNEECPSVHGEGTVKGEVAVFGCSDGVLVYADGEFTKVAAPDAYGRTGNAYVTDTSSLMVGDYNSNPDSEGYLLSKLALVDTETKTMQVVDLPEGVEYTWRDVARGPSDEILVLSADGSLYVLDETGAVTDSYPVIEAWESPVEWQDAHPALSVVDGVAYVTEPAAKKIHAIDVATGEILTSATLDAAPNEIAVVN
ncbi:hypothetical protein MN032_01845 [Agromyces atrinae]|uniref:zinc metallochaperone AztD n=1 Tax=Agromyces atrinae TaxID=592376 RepID=UPI001F570880|nr:zinc metallochaperone AztD [Agromyces atrinae]MCI2956421.1 hypothetical protein [Agromyces atrinae]